MKRVLFTTLEFYDAKKAIEAVIAATGDDIKGQDKIRRLRNALWSMSKFKKTKERIKFK